MKKLTGSSHQHAFVQSTSNPMIYAYKMIHEDGTSQEKPEIAEEAS